MIADQVYSCGPRPLGGQLMHRLMHFGPLLAPWPALGPTPRTATRAGGGFAVSGGGIWDRPVGPRGILGKWLYERF